MSPPRAQPARSRRWLTAQRLLIRALLVGATLSGVGLLVATFLLGGPEHPLWYAGLGGLALTGVAQLLHLRYLGAPFTANSKRQVAFIAAEITLIVIALVAL